MEFKQVKLSASGVAQFVPELLWHEGTPVFCSYGCSGVKAGSRHPRDWVALPGASLAARGADKTFVRVLGELTQETERIVWFWIVLKDLDVDDG